MRCPKCQYISFESGDKCRNCGYELSLTFDAADLDLPIKTGTEPMGPLADLDLDAAPLMTPAEGPAPPPAARPGAGGGRGAPGPGEFPLFRAGGVEEDAPLVAMPAAPRAPMAVRKSSLAPPRATRHQEEPELDLEMPGEEGVHADHSGGSPRLPGATAATAVADGLPQTASAGSRVLAALIDLVLLASIDAGVLYLTLRLSGVAFSEIAMLPVVPFASFLAILNGGYLVIFTVAGGQTIGKMAAGIKTVNDDESAATDRVPLAQAVIRAVAVLVTVAPAGLGFLPALVGADRRALHDRIAGTRVVRV
jgi:uncharacterized RDD family membrane protein YckC